VKSSQDTLPTANAARIKQAEKKQKSAHRMFLSLDNRGPHKGSAGKTRGIASAWDDAPTCYDDGEDEVGKKC
jgi:hypothetical protein